MRLMFASESGLGRFLMKIQAAKEDTLGGLIEDTTRHSRLSLQPNYFWRR